MTKMRANRPVAVPLVVHKIVHDGYGHDFEDISISLFKRILELIGGRCPSLDAPPAVSKHPAMSYFLTFDDGNSSDAEIALPLLLEMNCSATFFLIADKINTPGYISSSQARELLAGGMALGSHSVTHQDMRMLSASQQREEFVASKMRIEDMIGLPVRYFSFPYGKFNPALLQMALDCGYEKVCTSRHGIARLPCTVLPRNSINGGMSWGTVLRTLEAGSLTRFQWVAEDIAKSSVMRLVGDDYYRLIRRMLTGTGGK